MPRLRRVFRLILILLIVLVAWAAVRAGTPVQAFRRQIVVSAPRQVAWDHFNRIGQWRTWLGEAGAPVGVGPTDIVGPQTSASFGGIAFRMQQFAPPEHWMWSASMLGMTVEYDHAFESIGERQTRIVFHQTITGFGNVVLAPLIGLITSVTGHQAALDRLAREIDALPGATR